LCLNFHGADIAGEYHPTCLKRGPRPEFATISFTRPIAHESPNGNKIEPWLQTLALKTAKRVTTSPLCSLKDSFGLKSEGSEPTTCKANPKADTSEPRDDEDALTIKARVHRTSQITSEAHAADWHVGSNHLLSTKGVSHLRLGANLSQVPPFLPDDVHYKELLLLLLGLPR